jgi:8-oxo-dGTP diphosphatase
MRDVTAAIWVAGGRVLIARRGPGDALAGRWEFPGGKVEPGEAPAAGLRRELAEEFGVDVPVGEFFGESVYRYDRGAIRLLAYRIAAAPVPLELRVHDQVCWADRAELAAADLLPADVPLARQLLNLDDWP